MIIPFTNKAKIVAFLRRSHARGKYQFRSREEIAKATGMLPVDVTLAIWIRDDASKKEADHRKDKYFIQLLRHSKTAQGYIWMWRLRKKWHRTFWQKVFHHTQNHEIQVQ